MFHLTLTVLCLLLAPAANATAFARQNLKSDKSKTSYAIGVRTGQNLASQNLNLDVQAVTAGVEHALQGDKKILMADKELTDILQKFQQGRRKKLEQLGEQNKKTGEEFLAANAKKEGVVTLKSGLQYKVLVKGKGATPKKHDTVVTHYVGTLIDGKEFDSSRRRGTPATFPVTGVIAGWVEALQLMPVGSKWKLYIPGQLAYGARGAGQMIGPHATLIFEIELLEIKKK